MEILKVGVLDVGFKPFVPQGEAETSKLLLKCISLCQGWGLWWECVSDFPTCFDVSIFSLTYG